MDLKAVRSNFAQYGVQAGLHDVAVKAVRRIMYFQVLNCIELTLPSVAPALLTAPKGFACRFLGEAELIRFARDPAMELDVPFVREALSKGDRCFGILRGEVLASYGWYSQLPTSITEELRFHFDRRDVYMYKGFTRPEFRGQRLHAVGMMKALEAYVAEGARGLVSYVESNNFPSLRSCYRLGYAYLGKIIVVRPARQFLIFPTGRCAERGIRIEALSSGQAASPAPART